MIQILLPEGPLANLYLVVLPLLITNSLRRIEVIWPSMTAWLAEPLDKLYLIIGQRAISITLKGVLLTTTIRVVLVIISIYLVMIGLLSDLLGSNLYLWHLAVLSSL